MHQPVLVRVHFPKLANYEMIAELGRGGMGVVYKARHLSLNRFVAVKMMLASASRDSLARFQIEAQAVARLRHPNIVQIYEIGEHDGAGFLAFEFVDGGNLADQIAGVPWDSRRAAQLVETLSQAIHHAHTTGIVHRDLKPANILLTANGTPKIGDFGLARALDTDSDLTATGVIVGTPRYMASEQASGRVRDHGPPTDIYSLGVIFYQLLTGQAPFVGATPMETIDRVLHQEPTPPRRLNPRAPRDCETICLKCLAKEASRRYADASQLADDLRRFLADEPILARPTRVIERTWRWCRRNPSWAAALALMMFVLVGVAAGAVAFGVYQEGVAKNLADQTDETQKALDQSKLLAATLENQKNETQQALDQSKSLSATLAVDRGLALCEQGDAAQGMLWLTRALTVLPDDHDDLEHLIRSSLGVWRTQLWGERRTTLRPVGGVSDVAYSPDGKSIVTASNGGVQFWDTASGTARTPPIAQKREAVKVAFSPEGSVVATATMDKNVQLWRTSTGQPIGLPIVGVPVIDHYLSDLPGSFRANGKRFVAASLSNTIRVVDTDTGVPGKPMQHDKAVSAVQFHPDGSRIVTGSDDGTVRVFGADSGELLVGPLRHSGKIRTVVFGPDGVSILATSTHTSARLWRPDGATIREFELTHHKPVNAAAFSPDGKLIATGSQDSTVQVWDAATGKPLGLPLNHHASVTQVIFCRGGEHLITRMEGGNRLSLWNAKTGTAIATLSHPSGIGRIVLSPDENWLATASWDGTVRLWSTRDGQAVASMLRHPAEVWSLAFHPDGRSLVVGLCDHSVS